MTPPQSGSSAWSCRALSLIADPAIKAAQGMSLASENHSLLAHMSGHRLRSAGDAGICVPVHHFLSTAADDPRTQHDRDRARADAGDRCRVVRAPVGIAGARVVAASGFRRSLRFYRKASEALPNMGGNYIVVTDSTGQQRLNTLKPFGDPLPQLPLSAKLRRVFDTGEPLIFDFFAAPHIGQSAITLEVPVFSNGKGIYFPAMGIFSHRPCGIFRPPNISPAWVTSIF